MTAKSITMRQEDWDLLIPGLERVAEDPDEDQATVNSARNLLELISESEEGEDLLEDEPEGEGESE